MKIEISSFTDSRGSGDYNLELSQKRAQSVVSYLINRGIDRGRMIAKGYGESKPVVDCVECTEAQHQQNRRTEFKLISQ
ncbi:OmpA family protein [Pedobacter changchengzhani]|uniref:OmpA family protein n=1 Tax=Pedobacter changchengzhani TaxID=2529274 RepID=A0A4R5MPS0_9SPHI|nr:OmpA family protein [Pedobacter changchengzhani]TDG37636.1 OmpA family protein [Pedobacter changchengzhani]TDG38037.1 OmpA family protein [Pedobacter changchengzhani]